MGLILLRRTVSLESCLLYLHCSTVHDVSSYYFYHSYYQSSNFKPNDLFYGLFTYFLGYNLINQREINELQL